MMEGERRGRERWRGTHRWPRVLPNRWCGVGASVGGSSSSVGGGVVAVPGRCHMWVLGRRLWGLGRVRGASWWLVVV